MEDWAARLGISKTGVTLLVLFIPSVDRWSRPIGQEHWVEQALEVLGLNFGGATAFPQGRGIWRDDDRDGQLDYDEPVVIQCYTSEAALEEKSDELRRFLLRMGRDSRQGAVGFVIDRHYLEIPFPLEES